MENGNGTLLINVVSCYIYYMCIINVCCLLKFNISPSYAYIVNISQNSCHSQ